MPTFLAATPSGPARHRLDDVRAGRSLRIGIIAPPWVAVPPPAYGGTELVIDTLARGLQAQGHQVRLFTVGESTCPVERDWLYPSAQSQIGMAIPELRHTIAAYNKLTGCDILHDHTLAGPVIAASQDVGVPVVTTVHSPFNEDLADLYRHAADRVPIIAISADQASRAPTGVPVATVIPHGIDLDSYQPRPRHRPSGNYLAVLSRMSPDKGIDVAIKVARRAGRRLKIAAKMREPVEYAYYHDVIEPLLGDGIEYVGEVDHHHKIRLLAGADVLLNPIQWPEPFGLAMIEALACGTPVIATPHGAAPEIVVPEVNGYLATTIDELAYAVGHLDRIDRRRCRYHALNHFSMQAMAAEHAAFYQEVIATRSGLLGGA